MREIEEVCFGYAPAVLMESLSTQTLDCHFVNEEPAKIEVGNTTIDAKLAWIRSDAGKIKQRRTMLCSYANLLTLLGFTVIPHYFDKDLRLIVFWTDRNTVRRCLSKLSLLDLNFLGDSRFLRRGVFLPPSGCLCHPDDGEPFLKNFSIETFSPVAKSPTRFLLGSRNPEVKLKGKFYNVKSGCVCTGSFFPVTSLTYPSERKIVASLERNVRKSRGF